ncbi:MAG: O-antigen ligase family protein [Pseudomonadota bacterium]
MTSPPAEPHAPHALVWLLAAILFAATDPVLPLLARGADDWAANLEAANAARKPGWAVIYLLAAGLLWLWRREGARAASALFALGPALAWFAASCLWSPAPADAAFGYVQFLLLLGFGLAAGVRLGPEGVVRAVARAALLALAASLAMALLSPPHAFGQQVNTGALRGVYGEKTHLATILAYGFVAAAFDAAGRRGPRPWLAPAALLAGILAARSSIALVQVAMAAGLALAWASFARARYAGPATLCAALAGLAALLAVLPAALSALGEDATLNGRLPLWAALWPHAEARPLVGHGFGGFWGEPEAEALRAAMGWNARGSHHGWLQALLAGGAVGLALWLMLWGQVAVRAAAALRPGAARTGAAGLGALTLAHLGWSLFESNQLGQMNVHALIAGLCLSLPASAPRLRATRAAESARSTKSGLPIT